jgi:hypothetical protein
MAAFRAARQYRQIELIYCGRLKMAPPGGRSRQDLARQTLDTSARGRRLGGIITTLECSKRFVTAEGLDIVN